jgi:hypothetical protein
MKHTYNEDKCIDHTCFTCKYDESKEAPCNCCYNDGGNVNNNCYWEPKIIDDILNSQLFQIVEEPQFSLKQLQRTDLEEKERKFNEKIVGNCIIDMLKLLSDEERTEVFSYFCQYCGCDNPKCQCWNDD